MYFHSRSEAGQKLAGELTAYKDQDAVIVALDNGGVVVAREIAKHLNAPLTMTFSQKVDVPGENMSLGVVTQEGDLVYDLSLSPGEIDEYYGEFHGYIDDQRRADVSKLNRLRIEDEVVDPHALKNKLVILVSDGLKNGILLVAAVALLKPIHVRRIIIAVPIASVEAVDRMHVLADELHCLSVTDNYISTDHYYDFNDDAAKTNIIKKESTSKQNG